MFRSFSRKWKNLFPQSCPKKFIRFLRESLVNLLKGNLQSKRWYHLTKFQNEVQILSLKKSLWSKEETFWHPKIIYSSKKLWLIPCLTLYLDMEQFVLVPVSVYNKKLNTQSGTEHELPKHQAARTIPRTKMIRSRRKQTKTVCQSSLFSRQKFVLSSYQALKFADFNIGWFGNWSFTVRLCSTNASFKRRRSILLITFLWRCWYIPNSN